MRLVHMLSRISVGTEHAGIPREPYRWENYINSVFCSGQCMVYGILSYILVFSCISSWGSFFNREGLKGKNVVHRYWNPMLGLWVKIAQLSFFFLFISFEINVIRTFQLNYDTYLLTKNLDLLMNQWRINTRITMK